MRVVQVRRGFPHITGHHTVPSIARTVLTSQLHADLACNAHPQNPRQSQQERNQQKKGAREREREMHHSIP